MNPILTIFLVIVIYVVTQRVLDWLAKCLPTLYRNIIRTIQVFLTKPETQQQQEEIIRDESDPEQPKYKTLQRWQTGSLRHRIAEYITHLEDGKGSVVTQMLWKAYIRCVSEHYRSIDTESARNDPLPLWLERLAVMAQDKRTRSSVLLCLFFIIVVLSAHLWMPYLGLYTATPKDKIRLLLNQSILECTNLTAIHAPYCFLYNEEVIDEKMLIELALTKPVFFTDMGTLIDEEEAAFPIDGLNLIMDHNESLYTPMLFHIASTLDPIGEFFSSSPTSKWQKRYLRPEQELIPLLTYIHHEELSRGAVTQHPCLCPLFLNIVANVSFLFDTSEQRWVVMAQPVLVKNNSFADLVASTVSSNEKSLFYKAHTYWQRYMSGSGEMIHYDSFVVEYTEPSMQLLGEMGLDLRQELSQLDNLNKKLKDGEFDKASLFYRPNEAATAVQLQRKKMHVSGNDAACFIYCDTLQKHFFARKNK